MFGDAGLVDYSWIKTRMKVQIKFTVEVDDHFRRVLADKNGRDGLATREEIKEWYSIASGSLDEDLIDDYERAKDRRADSCLNK